MPALHQRQRERAGLDAGQVNGDEPESRLGDRGMDRRPRWFGRYPLEIISGQLDARNIAVMPHPDIIESEAAQRRLGPLDLTQLRRVDWVEMRDA
jgi:hypothetical protein